MLPTSDIKAVIFDYGATLDTGGDHWCHVFLDAWRQAGVGLSFDTFREAYIAGERALAPDANGEPPVSTDCTFRQLLGIKTRRQARLLAGNGAVAADSAVRLADEVAAICHASARAHTAHAAGILRRLSRRYPLAVASNFYGNLRAVLSEFGLLPLFSVVVDSAVAGVRKPDPALFGLACRGLGVAPEAALVVGDSAAKDILPAAALGCRTALVPGRGWPGASPVPCRPDMCGSLDEIADALLA